MHGLFECHCLGTHCVKKLLECWVLVSQHFSVIFFFYIPDIKGKVIGMVVCACIHFQVKKFVAQLSLRLFLLAFIFLKY